MCVCACPFGWFCSTLLDHQAASSDVGSNYQAVLKHKKSTLCWESLWESTSGGPGDMFPLFFRVISGPGWQAAALWCHFLPTESAKVIIEALEHQLFTVHCAALSAVLQHLIKGAFCMICDSNSNVTFSMKASLMYSPSLLSFDTCTD